MRCTEAMCVCSVDRMAVAFRIVPLRDRLRSRPLPGERWRYPTDGYAALRGMRTSLKQMSTVKSLRERLPCDTPNGQDGEYGLDDVDHFIFDDRIELALHTVIYIAESLSDAGKKAPSDFWDGADQLCTELLAANLRSTYRDVLTDTHQAIHRCRMPNGD